LNAIIVHFGKQTTTLCLAEDSKEGLLEPGPSTVFRRTGLIDQFIIKRLPGQYCVAVECSIGCQPGRMTHPSNRLAYLLDLIAAPKLV
jgi:hypothetical protein